jgi:hypothetical protein
VILEPGERQPLSRLELALDQDVADHAAVAGNGLEGEEADAGHVLAVETAVSPAEELIAAADGKHGGALRNRLVQRVRLVHEILGNEELLPVLPAADVIEVVLSRSDRVVDAQRRHLELVAPPRCALFEHGDVAPVGVDVEVIRIKVPDPDDGHWECSQYGLARPRDASTRWRPSIAV